MSTLLHLDASVRGDSLSRELSQRYADRWQQMTPDGKIIRRDLAADPLPHVNERQAAHLMYRTASQDEEKPEEVERSERLMDELRSADRLLLGTPMYNFTVPSTVKAWIDHVTWPGHTFDPIAGEGFVNVPAVVVISRGGAYGPEAPRADFNFQEPYLRKVFGLIGIVDVEFVAAELRMFTVENSPDEKLKAMGEQSLQDARERIDKLTPVPA
jgi:FMN-dependent NADH-azoreductase